MITSSKRTFPPEPGLSHTTFAWIAAAVAAVYGFFALVVLFAS